ADHDRVAEDRVGAEHAQVGEPCDRRLAVTAQHLVELDDGLRGVELPGALAFVGGALGRLQQIGRARADLSRPEEATHEVAAGAGVAPASGRSSAWRRARPRRPAACPPALPPGRPAPGRQRAEGSRRPRDTRTPKPPARPGRWPGPPPISITVVTPPRRSST